MDIMIKNVDNKTSSKYILEELQVKTGLKEGDIIKDVKVQKQSNDISFIYNSNPVILELDKTCKKYIKYKDICTLLKSSNLSKEENILANKCLNFLLEFEHLAGEEDVQDFIRLFYLLCAERSNNPNQISLSI